MSKQRTLALALALALTMPLTPGAERRWWAQTPSPDPSPSFTVPDTLPQTAILRIDGSPSMVALSQELAQHFQQRFQNAAVALASQGSDQAFQALQAGDIDLVALGRPLTDAEKEAGLTAVTINREKIAIIVSPDNPFQGSLTFRQFAQIFRGEITNWSQLGGDDRPLRFIDRPVTSDIRQALSDYDIFKEKPFETGPTAETVATDSAAAVVRQLGRDGIGYALGSQVLNQATVRVVPMHGTLPDDERYPYSQPRNYVYLDEPSASAQAFLAMVTQPDAQPAISAAQQIEAASVAAAAVLPGALAISPDGQLQVQGTETGQLIWLDSAGNPTDTVVDAHGGPVTGLGFSPDGQVLISSGADGRLQRWDRQGSPLGSAITAAAGPVTTLAISPNGPTIISGSRDGRLRRWDLEGNPQGDPIVAHQGAVRALAVAADGSSWMTGGDETVRFWNGDGTPQGDPIPVPSAITALVASPDGQRYASGDSGGRLQRWNRDGGAVGEPIAAHEGEVTALALSPDGNTLVSSGQDQTLQLWTWDGSAAAPGQGDLPLPIHALQFKANGQRVLSLMADGTTQLRDSQGNPVSQSQAPSPAPTVTPPETPTSPGPLPAFWQTLPPWALGAIAAAMVLVLFLLGWLTRRRSQAKTEPSASSAATSLQPAPSPAGQDDDTPDNDDSDIALGSRLGDAEHEMEYALAMAKEGQLDEALNHVHRAIEVADLERLKALAAGASVTGVVALMAQGLARRGGLLGLLGHSDDAVENFDRALELNADSIDAWVGKGQLLLEQQRPQQALQAFEAALERAPDLPVALAGKGKALQQLGRSQEAQPLLDQAAAKGVEHVDLLQALDPGSIGLGAAAAVGAGAAALAALQRGISEDSRDEGDNGDGDRAESSAPGAAEAAVEKDDSQDLQGQAGELPAAGDQIPAAAAPSEADDVPTDFSDQGSPLPGDEQGSAAPDWPDAAPLDDKSLAGAADVVTTAEPPEALTEAADDPSAPLPPELIEALAGIPQELESESTTTASSAAPLPPPLPANPKLQSEQEGS